MKFGWLIEFFLKDHTRYVVEKLVPDSNKKKNLSISLDHQSEIFKSFLLLYVLVEVY